jgi:hypothetical protein
LTGYVKIGSLLPPSPLIVSNAVCREAFRGQDQDFEHRSIVDFSGEAVAFGDRFKRAPIAIVPGEDGWEVVTSQRYRNAEPQLAKRIAQIQAELRAVYRLARD